jgi:hypothetical protein
MNNRNLILAVAIAIVLLGLIFFHKNQCPCELIKQESKALIDDSKYQNTIIILQDSISKYKSENLKLNEKNALLINANLSLSGRIRAINEYISTGRLPSDSNIR